MNFEKLDEIIQLSPFIRYVSLVDPKGIIIDSRIRNDLKQSPDGEGYLCFDFLIVRKIANIQEDSLGKIHLMLTTREKIHEFFIFLKTDSLPAYVIFDKLDLSKRAEIAEKIQTIVQEMIPIVK